MVGRTPKGFLGIQEDQKGSTGEFEPMCSPITQTKILNEVATDFNIIFGLRVGYDSLFMRYSNALCTNLVTKDRVTGHNPLAAIKLHKSSYRRLKKEKFPEGNRITVTVKMIDSKEI